MSCESGETLHPDHEQAVARIKDLILAIAPTATFIVESEMDDPRGTYVIAQLDMDDPDDILDEIIDDVLHIQIDEGLPVYVIPERTPERVEQILRERAQRTWPPAGRALLPT